MRSFLLGALTLLAVSAPAFASDSELSGGWASRCTPLIKRHSAVSELELSADEIRSVHRLYADRECRILNLEIVARGLYRVAGREFYWVSGPVMLKLLSDAVVEHYNAHSICGFDEWKIGEARDVTGLMCEPIQMPSSGVIYEDGYEVRDGILEFGHFPELPDAGHKVFARPLRYHRAELR